MKNISSKLKINNTVIIHNVTSNSPYTYDTTYEIVIENFTSNYINNIQIHNLMFGYLNANSALDGGAAQIVSINIASNNDSMLLVALPAEIANGLFFQNTSYLAPYTLNIIQYTISGTIQNNIYSNSLNNTIVVTGYIVKIGKHKKYGKSSISPILPIYVKSQTVGYTTSITNNSENIINNPANSNGAVTSDITIIQNANANNNTSQTDTNANVVNQPGNSGINDNNNTNQNNDTNSNTNQSGIGNTSTNNSGNNN